ncbi:MAG: hypothetical protein HC904_02030 [Blastochloris sp.]|nr:hypothetical protein [Blastochloris sp.]
MTKSLASVAAPTLVLPGGRTPERLSLPHKVLAPLKAIISRHLNTGITQGVFLVLGSAALLIAVQCCLDWWLDFPWMVRLLFFLMDLALLGWLAHVSIYQVWLKRLNLSSAALKAEKATPGMKSVLISAVQLAEGGAGAMQGSPDLLRALIEHAGERIRVLDLSKIVPTRPMLKVVAGALASVLLVVGLAFWQSDKSPTLIQRFFLLNPPLPTLTIVEPVTREMSVALGSNVELAALAKGQVPSRGRVTITYSNGQSQDIGLTGSVGKPELFSTTMKNVQQSFSYRFFLNDGRGEQFLVKTLLPPQVAQLDCEEIYPEYTGLARVKRTPGNLSLLAGSKLNLRVSSNQPLKSAKVELQGLNQQIEMKLDNIRGTWPRWTFPSRPKT